MNHRTLKIIAVIALVLSLAITKPAAAKTVKDQLGRMVDVPDEPRRVVALAPSITEIVFALGQEDRLKGVTIYSDFPPAATVLPKVGSYIRLDLERIVALKPDLCIAVKDGNPKAIAQRLELLKIPVYAVNPRNLETVMQTVLEIGRLLNADEKANVLVQNMRSRILKVQSLVAKTTYRPRVFFQIGIVPIVSIGTDTFIHELIVLAGGKNLAAGAVAYPRFSQEQVLALSPEVFIITSMTRAAVFEQVKAEWSRWPDMPAVRNRRILLEDSNLFDRPTPRLVDALELLVRRIHPELFKEAD
ncbi:MAG: cobalamin-binding protein [Desulfobacterales bacterium]|uniref:Cobalamin-binding protein n=1 Tax=Candidatus Desulfatibia profunda TaxID=2841695 RepID=A0A8J6NVY9_9BACT|nr:cobalamin-binding protein [Candidatus Desulfatibia profunda]MBL7180358.1 cobalamin-binding protein [Desulfobacterales bacterium]